MTQQRFDESKQALVCEAITEPPPEIKREAEIALEQEKRFRTKEVNMSGRSDLEYPSQRDRPLPLIDFSYPAEITLVELGVIKLTAQFMAWYGDAFWSALTDHVLENENPRFSFLKTTAKSHNCLFNGLVAVYQRVLRPRNFYKNLILDKDRLLKAFYHRLQLEKLDEKLIDLHAFVSGLDFFARMDPDPLLANFMPPPQPISVLMMHPQMPPLTGESFVGDAKQDLGRPEYNFPARITLKELGIMKLTAQFVARYGKRFHRALMMRVLTVPQFEFMFFRRDRRPQFQSMEAAEIRFHVFSKLVDAYSAIIIPCKALGKIDPSLASVLEAFFLRLQLEKLEEGVESAMIDLHALVSGSVDYFAHMEDDYYSAIMAPPESLSVMMNRPTHSLLVLLPQGPELRDYCRIPSRIFEFALGSTHEELGLIKLTAQFTRLYGKSFKRALRSRMSMEPRFEFIRLSTGFWGLVFRVFRDMYSKVLNPSKKAMKSDDCTALALEVFFHFLELEKLKKGVESSGVELHAFISGADYFTYMDNKDTDYSSFMPPPKRLSVMMVNQESAANGCVGDITRLLCFHSRCVHRYVTPKELAFIKLTALFAARYGMVFCRDLMKKVAMDSRTEFKFMEPSDRSFRFYSAVVDAYSKVLKDCGDDYTETVLETFFNRLECDKEEDMVDLYAFVEGVDCFAQMEDDSYSLLMGKRLLRQMHCDHPYARFSTGMMQSALTRPGKACHPPPEEEPELKRQKFDGSAPSPQDQFSSSTIRVSVPGGDGEEVIEVTVKSLSENVASLKEKIAAVVQVPANRLKLSGKAGLLNDDNKSLADSNVAAEDILTLSCRRSRWDLGKCLCGRIHECFF